MSQIQNVLKDIKEVCPDYIHCINGYDVNGPQIFIFLATDPSEAISLLIPYMQGKVRNDQLTRKDKVAILEGANIAIKSLMNKGGSSK